MNHHNGTDTAAMQTDLGRTVLGPIFFDFCDRLHSHLAAHAGPGRPTALLYMARAGLRLRYLYELYCQAQKAAPALEGKDFYASRWSVAKGCLESDFDYVLPIILSCFGPANLATLAHSTLGPEVALPQAWEATPLTAESFRTLYRGDEPAGRAVREYFATQADLLTRYVEGHVGCHSRVFLVDSGWMGKTQAMLMRRFPKVQWTGLYFGKWDYRRAAPSHFANIVGICLDGIDYEPDKPPTALFHHFHLIEGPLEPELTSTGAYLERDGAVVPDYPDGKPSSIPPGPRDTHFTGIVEYFRDRGPGIASAIRDNAEKAYRELRRLILYPRRCEVPMLDLPERSHDFGRAFTVPVLLDPAAGGRSLRDRCGRIQQALWKPGQVALEFPRTAWLIQRLKRFPPAV